MSYLVTREDPPAIEELPTLEAALERAGQLVSNNYFDVAIKDGKGNQVSGDDLIACYLGVAKLSGDLRVTQMPVSPEK